MTKLSSCFRSTRCLAAALLLAVVCGVPCEAKQRAPWTTSKISGAPTPPAPYKIEPAFPGRAFDNPSSLRELPGGRMLVSEIGGKLFTFDKSDRSGNTKDLLLEIDGEPRVWHATVHPKFEDNGLLLVCYSKGGTSHVSKFRTSGSPLKADPDSEQVLLTWPAGGHNAGCLRFGVDGMLYISTGDGSGPNPPDGRTAAQDVGNLFGCILRIDVDKQAEGKPYAVPADNPFVDLAGARPEIWAYGLRNPWKFGVDAKTGEIFAADNGWESWEMVHRIVRGGNCGWPIMEGRAALRDEVKRGPTPIRPPVKDHSHTEANSVIGGPVYRGAQLNDLDGTFVYGDYITGTIWGLKKSGNDYEHRTLVDTDLRITHFAEGSQGELWVLDYDYTGQVYRLVASEEPDRSAKFPRKLSETGLFRSLETLRPAEGVIPYAVNVPRWMDGMKTRRWLAIPGDGSITLGDGEQPASYPDGTVLVKHISMPKRYNNGRETPVETQLLHYENGTWRPYSYLWNRVIDDEPYDATLVDASGADHYAAYARDESQRLMGRDWHISAENECRLCHNAASGYVLGFEPHQLQRAYFGPPSRSVANQLRTLFEERTITKMPEFPENDPARLVDPHDEEQSLDDRARSYLHGNCSSCHHRRGNAIVSFYLRRELPFDQLNTNKGTGIGTFGMKNAKLIVPGDPYRSVLLYRMSKLGYGRMPYIGSRVVDSRGVALIERWIREMPHEDSREDSAPVTAGSEEENALLRATGIRYPLVRPKEFPISALISSTEGALALASAIHGGEVGAMGAVEVYKTTPSDIRGLFEDFVRPGLRRRTLGRNIDPQRVLKLRGDKQRGRLIFFSDAARCRNCHHADDPAQSTGPTLAEIRKKYERRSEMLTHVLKPSLKVDDKFVTWVVRTQDGRVVNGLLLRQSDDQVVLKTAERKQVVIPKTDIQQMKKSDVSLMPQGILADLTAQEAADLIEWFGR